MVAYCNTSSMHGLNVFLFAHQNASLSQALAVFGTDDGMLRGHVLQLRIVIFCIHVWAFDPL